MTSTLGRNVREEIWADPRDKTMNEAMHEGVIAKRIDAELEGMHEVWEDVRYHIKPLTGAWT